MNSKKITKSPKLLSVDTSQIAFEFNMLRLGIKHLRRKHKVKKITEEKMLKDALSF